MSLVKICCKLDRLGLYHLSDAIFKIANKNNILKKRIYIPQEVKDVAKEAYDKRFDKLKFGNNNQYEIARLLHTRNYLEISSILEIHEYTVDKRYSYSKKGTNPTHWEYKLHGGEEGRRWASDIIKIYLPKKWKIN